MSGVSRRVRKDAKAINTTNIGSLAITSPSAVASVVGAPTKAEFDAVVLLANELKTDLNALLTALKA